MAIGAKENVKWVDGLRGIASITVVITHLFRAFDPNIFAASPGEHQHPRLLQLPFIRVFIQGRIGVAIFSLVTGYVCALKPIKLARTQKYEDALVSVAKSAFRRVPRLILPTTIITAIIWFMCQFGMFEIARRCDSDWLGYTSPPITPYVGNAVIDLVNQLIRTWVYGQNHYDPNQWTMHPLLKGSMLVYMMIFATLYLQPKYRMMTCMGMYIYYWVGQESVFGMQFFFGFFMADLQSLPAAAPAALSPTRARRFLQLFHAPILLFLGLYLASYPERDAEHLTWSRQLHTIGALILPDGYDIARFYTAWGLELIVLGIHFSPKAKDVLSNQTFLWLGKNSFAVYLIHGALMRTVLTYCLYGFRMPSDVRHEDGSVTPGDKLKLGGTLRMAFWIPIFLVLLYSVAHVWTTRVDPKCAEWTKAIEKYMFKDESQNDGLLGNISGDQAMAKREDTPPPPSQTQHDVEKQSPNVSILLN